MANNALLCTMTALLALLNLWPVSPAHAGEEIDPSVIDPILSKFPPPYEAGVARTPIDGHQLDAAVADPVRFLEANRLTPYAVPGWRTAYRLESIGDPVLRAIGLEEDDLILGVNGVNPDSLEQLTTVLGMLRHASLLQLVIQRRGVIFALSVEIPVRRTPL